MRGVLHVVALLMVASQGLGRERSTADLIVPSESFLSLHEGADEVAGEVDLADPSGEDLLITELKGGRRLFRRRRRRRRNGGGGGGANWRVTGHVVVGGKGFATFTPPPTTVANWNQGVSFQAGGNIVAAYPRPVLINQDDCLDPLQVRQLNMLQVAPDLATPEFNRCLTASYEVALGLSAEMDSKLETDVNLSTASEEEEQGQHEQEEEELEQQENDDGNGSSDEQEEEQESADAGDELWSIAGHASFGSRRGGGARTSAELHFGQPGFRASIYRGRNRVAWGMRARYVRHINRAAKLEVQLRREQQLSQTRMRNGNGDLHAQLAVVLRQRLASLKLLIALERAKLRRYRDPKSIKARHRRRCHARARCVVQALNRLRTKYPSRWFNSCLMRNPVTSFLAVTSQTTATSTSKATSSKASATASEARDPEAAITDDVDGDVLAAYLPPMGKKRAELEQMAYRDMQAFAARQRTLIRSGVLPNPLQVAITARRDAEHVRFCVKHGKEHADREAALRRLAEKYRNEKVRRHRHFVTQIHKAVNRKFSRMLNDFMSNYMRSSAYSARQPENAQRYAEEWDRVHRRTYLPREKNRDPEPGETEDLPPGSKDRGLINMDLFSNANKVKPIANPALADKP